MKITKKDSRELWNSLEFLSKALPSKNDLKSYKTAPVFGMIYVENKIGYATDGARLNYACLPKFKDGLYNYSKTKSTIEMKKNKTNLTYAPVHSVIPENFNHIVNVSRQELIDRLKQARVIIDKWRPGLYLKLKWQLDIEVVNPDIGDMNTQVKTDRPVEAEEKIKMNCKYLLEAISHLSGDCLTIGLQKEPKNKPLMLWGDDKNTKALIMPMRI